MLIVLPVSVSDRHLIPSFLASVQRAGNIKNHDVVVLTTPSAAIEAGQLAGEMSNFASSSKVVQLKAELFHGWPFAPNAHFCEAVNWVAENKIQSHWYWMELDCTALKPGWADALDQEYRESRKMFMGAVVPTIKIRRPNTPQAEPFQQGTHMVGTGIYPPIMPHWCIGWRTSKMRPNGPNDIQDEDTPFDVTMGYETMQSLHDTKLIQHQFRTVNYHMDGDYIVGEDQAPLLGVSFTGRVSEDAVVHHGCKDGSLSKLLCSMDEKEETKKDDDTTEIIQPKKSGRKPLPKTQDIILEPDL